MHPPTCRVSEVPELIGLICSFTEKSNLPNLLTVSRRFFYCVAPLIWKDVVGLKKLLDLLPRIDLENIQLDPLGHLSPYNQVQLARFNTYAPFIRSFQSNIDEDWGMITWAILPTKLATRPLLPNLKTLAIYHNDCKDSSPRGITAIDMFLCPTLTTIHTRQSYDLWMSPIYAGSLLARITHMCPNISELELMLGNLRYPENVLSFDTYSKAAFFSSFGQLRNLRVLNSSAVVLDPGVLQLLGGLPQLESITAHSVAERGIVDDVIPISNLALSAHSFPALRHLAVYRVPNSVISKLWQTPPLVQNLVSIAVEFDPSTAESLNDLICIICRGSPQTVDFFLDLEQSSYIELSQPVIEHFQQLPLQRVRIYGGHNDYELIVSALPNVEYLGMNEMILDFEGLALVARSMPKLQYLSVNLVLRNWTLEPPPNSSSPSTCNIECTFMFEDELDMDDPEFEDYLDTMARALHSMWPKGVQCTITGLSKASDGDTDSDIVNRLNEMIKALTDTSEHYVPSVEELEARWLYA